LKIKWYSKQGLLTLFLMCAFLPHVWTFIMAFNDASMLIYRMRGVWGAIGVLSYGLLFSFVESLFVFLITSLLGLLISSRWDESRRIVLLGWLVTVTLLWVILSQSYYAWHMHVPVRIVRFVAQFPYPFQTVYVAAGASALVTALVPALLILQHKGFYDFARAAMERITFLSAVYLVINVLALIVVIVRNI